MSKQAKKLPVAEALKLWLGGKGRSELAEATGLDRGALKAAFVKLSKKSWRELNIESGRVKPKAKKAAGRKVQAA